MQIALHDLLSLHPTRDFLPATFRQLCNVVDHGIDPTVPPDDAPDIRLPPDPGRPPRLDRDTISLIADWCLENEEPWMAKACRFILKHQDITVTRSQILGRHFGFEKMPTGWYSSYQPSFAELLADLAREIQKRMEALNF